jgi:hypothetical protein
MVTQAGSLIGLIDGINRSVGTSGLSYGGIMYHRGSPADILTANNGSDVVLDIVNKNYYMALGQGGSTWIRLVSGT